MIFVFTQNMTYGKMRKDGIVAAQSAVICTKTNGIKKWQKDADTAMTFIASDVQNKTTVLSGQEGGKLNHLLRQRSDHQLIVTCI